MSYVWITAQYFTFVHALMLDNKKPNKKFNIHFTLWWSIAWVFLIINIAVVLYWWYLNLEVRKYDRIVEQKEELVLEKQRELARERNNPAIIRFNASRYIEQQAWIRSWKWRTIYLIDLYNVLLDLDARDRNISFQNYSIQDDRISLRGQINSIQVLYREWWLLTRLEQLPFMKEIEIQSYARITEEDDEGVLPQWFSFVLTALIQEYEW